MTIIISELLFLLTFECFSEEEIEDLVMDVVNSVVLGATLFDSNRNVIMARNNVKVSLTFQYNYDGYSYLLSGE